MQINQKYKLAMYIWHIFLFIRLAFCERILETRALLFWQRLFLCARTIALNDTNKQIWIRNMGHKYFSANTR